MDKKQIIAVIYTGKNVISTSGVLTYKAKDIKCAEEVALALSKVTFSTIHKIDPYVYVLVN